MAPAQGQTLAARSARSSAQLLSARTADGGLVVAGGAAGSGGASRLSGLRLPQAWHSFEEVPRGAYLSGHDGRLQRFEIMVEMTEVCS